MVERRYCVYCHTNLTNGKKYIGITRKKPEYRWNNGSGYKKQEYFHRAIQKYGWDGFLHEVLYSNLTEQEAKTLERKLIKEYDTRNKDLGYNITGGGDGFLKYATEEEAIVAKKSVAKRSREKRRDKRTAELKAWRSNNRDHVNEYKREYYHRTKKLKGCRSPLAEDTKKKIGIANSRTVMAILNGAVIMTFNSFAEAEKALGISHSNICRSIRTGMKCGGYNWAKPEGGVQAVNN